MNNRLEKINETLKHEISIILIELAEENWGIFILTDVQVSPDLTIARIWIDGTDLAVKKMTEHTHEIFLALRPRIRFKHVPHLKFIKDDESVNRIEEMLERINEA